MPVTTFLKSGGPAVGTVTASGPPYPAALKPPAADRPKSNTGDEGDEKERIAKSLALVFG